MTIFGKIIKGITSVGGSVLSLVSPTLGGIVTGISNSIGGASTDKVAAAGQVVAAGAVKAVQATTNAAANELTTALSKKAAYDSYIAAGYTAQAASVASGYSNVVTATIPTWIWFAGGGFLLVVIFLLLSKKHR